jgi:ketosteroid isomerase-like protein
MRATRLLVPLLVVSCQRPEAIQQEPSIEDQSRQARTEIEATLATWERWVAEGKVDSLASLLTENTNILPPNAPPIVGRDAWLAVFRPQLTTGKWSEDVVTESVVAYGPLAVERGSYTLSFTPGPGTPASMRAMSDTGKYLWHWHKVDGRWLIAEAAWSSNRPAQP